MTADMIELDYPAARGAVRLGIDLYLPGDTPEALVVFAHGGGFSHGRRRNGFARECAARLNAGRIAFAAIDYSKGGDPSARWTARDRAAIAAAQERTARVGLKINPQYCGPLFYAALEDMSSALATLRGPDSPAPMADIPAIAFGVSAGGILAASLAHPPGGWDWLERPDGAFGIAAAMVQPWRLDRTGPPVTMLHGPHDGVIRPMNLKLLDRKARDKEAPVEVVFTDIRGHRPQLDAFLSGHDPDGAPWFDRLPALVEKAHTYRAMRAQTEA